MSVFVSLSLCSCSCTRDSLTSCSSSQLQRKRFIGNDIVTIVFQDTAAHSFSPLVLRSNYQRVVIIVRPTELGADGCAVAFRCAVP